MMRTPNSWIKSPSAAAGVGSGENPPSATKLPLSDSKRRSSSTRPFGRANNNNSNSNYNTYHNSSSHSRRLSMAEDKENNNHGSDNEGLVFLTSPKDTLSMHSSRRKNQNNTSLTALDMLSPNSGFNLLPNRSMPLQEFVMAEPHSEYDDLLLDTSSPSSNSASDSEVKYYEVDASPTSHLSDGSALFQSGKTFWMKFLDPNDARMTPTRTAIGNHSAPSQKTNTPTGSLIQRTFTSGSPLSEASAFMTEDDDLIDSDEATPSSISESVTSEVSEAWRPVVWKKQASTEGLVEMDLPKEESVVLVVSARQHFEQLAETSPPKSNTEAVRSSRRTPPSWSGAKYPPQKPGAETSSTEQPIKPSPLRRDPLKVSTTTSSASTRRPTPSTPDSMIEIGGPFATPTSLAATPSGHSLSAVSPKDQTHFAQAYSAWQRAGLMPKQGTSRNKSPNTVVLEEARKQTQNEKATLESTAAALALARQSLKSMPTNNNDTKKTTPQTAQQQTEPNVGINSPGKRSSPGSVVKTDTSSNTESGEIAGEFRNLLQTWRTKSDDKPNAHFLSPEKTKDLESKMDRCTVLHTKVDDRSSQSVQLLAKQPSQSLSNIELEVTPAPETSIAITCRIQAFDKDYFDRVREQQSATHANEEEHEKEDSLGPMVPGSFALPVHPKRSAHFVDSDLYEDSFVDYEEPSRALVILENNDTYQIMVGDSRQAATSMSDELRIANVELVTSSQCIETQLTEYRPCKCSGSIFSGNDDLISFFLPQMGMACVCGKQRPLGFVNPDEPTAIENVLRPWQVEFLKSFGIYRGEQLVKARHRSYGILAKALRQWRKKHGMAPFNTNSCGMAIDIWAKTCKVYVRSVRQQLRTGKNPMDRRPDQVMRELTQFLGDLPAAPKRRIAVTTTNPAASMPLALQIEPDSQMEV